MRTALCPVYDAALDLPLGLHYPAQRWCSASGAEGATDKCHAFAGKPSIPEVLCVFSTVCGQNQF
eukprot:1877233-Amphidinium_carterae.1